MKTSRIVVTGRVQVEILVQADDATLRAFIEEVKEMPENPSAHVDNIQVVETFNSEEMVKFRTVY